ncbi:pleckstrin homology domain-containing family J member 1-like [Neocloeon triangulifer]|uniref:pleckstrin homology domain-containing family J member 1-like n=1 Tax=Neocloeon triangulifer TaxID=2078957 RepID=UPI00286F3F7D|nr:pleckstrin homology domain-containing family J member 1-like [Neocloeon triangulifer]XP_059485981.1 pleckstrin homology domain-containing family J member 1-like [Neocloeon triangulifer]
MRFNEKEMADYGCSPGTVFEGRLNYKVPAGNFSQAVFKERWFKLKSNLLFYFRFTEFGSVDANEPVGVFVLENFKIQIEESKEMPFAFSITFHDDVEKKQYFAARSEELVNSWVSAISQSSYEYMRQKLHTLQNMVKTASGLDRVTLQPFCATARDLEQQLQAPQSPSRPSRKGSKLKSSQFKSHIAEFVAPENKPRTSMPIVSQNIPARMPNNTSLRASSPLMPIRQAPPPPTKPPPSTKPPPVKDLIEF